MVYLNGQEVSRGHLPDGDITPETFAKEYPREAYVDEDVAAKLLRTAEQMAAAGTQVDVRHYVPAMAAA